MSDVNWCHPNGLIRITVNVSEESDYYKATLQQYL